MNKSEQLLHDLNILEKEIWDKPNPKAKHKKMTPAMKRRAKARAKAAGRPYPNAVDNIAVSRGA